MFLTIQSDMFIVSVVWNKDISCELLSHVTRDLCLIM